MNLNRENSKLEVGETNAEKGKYMKTCDNTTSQVTDKYIDKWQEIHFNRKYPKRVKCAAIDKALIL